MSQATLSQDLPPPDTTPHDLERGPSGVEGTVEPTPTLTLAGLDAAPNAPLDDTWSALAPADGAEALAAAPDPGAAALEARRAEVTQLKEQVQADQVTLATAAAEAKRDAVDEANLASLVAGPITPELASSLVLGLITGLIGATAIGGLAAFVDGGLIAAAASLALGLVGTVSAALTTLGPVVGVVLGSAVAAAAATSLVLVATGLDRAVAKLEEAEGKTDEAAMGSAVEAARNEAMGAKAAAAQERDAQAGRRASAEAARTKAAGAYDLASQLLRFLNQIPWIGGAGGTAASAAQAQVDATDHAAESAGILEGEAGAQGATVMADLRKMVELKEKMEQDTAHPLS